MKFEEVAALLSRGRIVDLSKQVNPGGAEGPLDTGKRKYEIEQFTFPPGELMHNITMESHISTHVEAPSHFVPVRYAKAAKDVSEVALEHFFGMAAFVDCKKLPLRAAVGREHLEKFDIRDNDIVLFGNCIHEGTDRCHLVKSAAEYLLEKKVKMMGIDDTVFPEDPDLPKTLENYLCHDLMLSNDIPIIEGLNHMDQLRKPRFLFFALPARMGGLEAFPIRAMAVEERE